MSKGTSMAKRDFEYLEPVAATKAKVNFGDLMYQVSVNRKKFVVNRQGKPVAVILGYNEYEQLVEGKGGD
jgi:prevent-host-death family protein